MTIALIARAPAAVFAAETQDSGPLLEHVEPDVEPEALREPAFPEPLARDGVRIGLGSSFVLPADFGDARLGLVRPEARLKVRLPINDTASVQVTGEFRASLYDVDGGALFQDCAGCPSPDSLYEAAVATQGGYQINRSWHLLHSAEQWAVLGTFAMRARWEPGAFEEAVTPGGALAIGYRLPLRLRIALGAQVERALDGDGVSVGPSFYLRWNVTPKVEVHTRGLGAELEYHLSDRVELFATGFRTSDRFRLDDRADLSSGATFRDRQVRAGAGVVLKIARRLRLTAEAGALLDRKVAIHTRDDGRLDSTSGDVAPYFAVHAELRP